MKSQGSNSELYIIFNYKFVDSNVLFDYYFMVASCDWIIKKNVLNCSIWHAGIPSIVLQKYGMHVENAVSKMYI